jgi:hypothetical protein
MMKRSLYYLVLVVVVAIVAAWSASRRWSAYRVHKAEEVAKAAELAESKKWAGHFAKLARECDEVVIKYLAQHDDPRDTEIRFSDPAWIENLAVILEGASCKSKQSHPGSIEPIIYKGPFICLYRKQAEALVIMAGFAIVRGSDLGEVLVGKESAVAITDLIHRKLPAE